MRVAEQLLLEIVSEEVRSSECAKDQPGENWVGSPAMEVPIRTHQGLGSAHFLVQEIRLRLDSATVDWSLQLSSWVARRAKTADKARLIQALVQSHDSPALSFGVFRSAALILRAGSWRCHFAKSSWQKAQLG